MKDFRNTCVIFAGNIPSMRQTILIITLLGFSVSLCGQTAKSDSLTHLPMVHVNIGFHMPGGDLAKRFGNNSSAGLGFLHYTPSRVLIGADYTFLFGNTIHNKDSVLKGISTSNGDIIDGNGLLAEVHMYERGFHSSLRLGYVFPILKATPRSGPFILLSGGLLQHKIRIENPMNVAPQIVGDYAKGYDKLTNGFALSQMVGYMYMGKNRLTNFYVGFEFIQAWTRSRRDWDFELMRKDETARLDLMNGVKVGWVLPIYKRAADRYYFH
jgi:hypothetical protein